MYDNVPLEPGSQRANMLLGVRREPFYAKNVPRVARADHLPSHVRCENANACSLERGALRPSRATRHGAAREQQQRADPRGARRFPSRQFLPTGPVCSLSFRVCGLVTSQRHHCEVHRILLAARCTLSDITVNGAALKAPFPAVSTKLFRVA